MKLLIDLVRDSDCVHAFIRGEMQGKRCHMRPFKEGVPWHPDFKSDDSVKRHFSWAFNSEIDEVPAVTLPECALASLRDALISWTTPS